MNQYSKQVSDLLSEFNSSESGLSKESYERSKEIHGLNKLDQAEAETILQIFLSQFKDVLVIILLIANFISLATDNIESSIVIMSVILLNAVLGTVQYVKAQKSLESLKALSAPYSVVIRNGEKIEVSSEEIVPGDILFLEAGNFVPADGRILQNFSLQVNESSLTGESEPITKTSAPLPDESIPVGDQTNMVFSGGLATYGRAKVLVTSTGMNTELGKIAHLLNTTAEKTTPLQASLDDFSKKLAAIILLICVLIFGLNIYRGTELIDSLMFAVALAVAAIPEALSSIVTIVLAMGTQKMAKENAIVKELKAVEGLGSVSVICSDKTGTLTQNKMKVLKAFVDLETFESSSLNTSDPLTRELLYTSVLCNDSSISAEGDIGDPTEVALLNLASYLSLDHEKIRAGHPRVDEIPFDSDRKLMTTCNTLEGKDYILTKGAVDVLLGRISSVKTSAGTVSMTSEIRAQIEEANRAFSENGLRVLAFAAKKRTSSALLTLADENDYVFMGLLAMIDPPREEAKKAVADCISAGIKPIMITGDHRITASAIAREIGILRDGDVAVNGAELDSLSDDELLHKVENISVYARVSPEHKIRIVRAWQNKNRIVAMTGDGVNDAPALKQADIGIAMGITGTDVSKDAASIVLSDDNFATIVKAISSGRSIFRNIKNAIKFLLSGNTAGILVVLYSTLANLPVPFAAVHLLFINLLTDSLPAIAIGMESESGDLLKEKPRKSNASIMDSVFLRKMFVEGSLIGIATILIFHFGLENGGDAYARTLAFATLCLARLFHGFNSRGDKSLVKLGFFSNKYNWLSFFAGNLFLLSVIFFAPLRNLFEVSRLGFNDLALIYGFAIAPTILIQLFRIFFIDGKDDK